MPADPGRRTVAMLPAPLSALDSLAVAALEAGDSTDEREALTPLARAVAAATGADAAIVRTLDPSGLWLVARAVAAASPALAAELEGSRLPASDLSGEEVADLTALPDQSARVAARLGASGALLLPLAAGGRTLGTLDLLRRASPFDDHERSLARIAAAQLTLRLLALGTADGADVARIGADEMLRLAGDSLAAGWDERAVAEQVAHLAAETSGATACLVWLTGEDGTPGLAAVHGIDRPLDQDALAERVGRALAGRRPTAFEPVGEGEVAAVLPLGQPPLGALELRFESGAEDRVDLARLATFGARAANALRAGARGRRLELELGRSRALLEVMGQAFAELSLEHMLRTAVERVAELLGVDRLAVYLRDGTVVTADDVRLTGPHRKVAERLLELAPRSSGEGLLTIDDMRRDPRVATIREGAAEAGIDAAVAVQLNVQDELTGVLAVYPERGRRLTANEETLLRALAVQLAVAVQNAGLHAEATQLGADLEHALDAERQSTRTLRALYEVSRSFAQSLSLDATLQALADSAVDLLGVDAGVIHAPDARRELLDACAFSVRDTGMAEAVRALLDRPLSPQMWPRRSGRRPLVLDPRTAAGVGAAGEALTTLLEMGWAVAVVPINAPADPNAGPPELVATLTLVSVAGRPFDTETVELAATIAGQAGLAVDNARLYQQQKSFADTMQRSLLPRERPRVEGLEVGDVYAPSARLDVGGDVYDYAVLDDGRLAVVLGDVTGHGVEATADMAMTTFMFRSVSREHPDPGDFLAHANEVVVEEVAAGKFVTLAYLTIDPRTGEVACALAGHPPPRIVTAGGDVRILAAGGLPLGIEVSQVYREVRDTLEPGDAVVLYTDGVVEARRDRELYGEERLDALLAARAADDPDALAKAVLAACRAFGGDELADDCAVVVIRRT